MRLYVTMETATEKRDMSGLAASYQKEGFLKEEILSPEFLALAEEGYKTAIRLLESPGGLQRKWTHTSGKVKHLVNVHREHPVFRNIIQFPTILEKLKVLYGDRPLFVTHSKLSFKFTGADQIWFPHQDSAYKNYDNAITAVAVLLENCDEGNGALQFFPESHKLGRLKHEIVFAYNESEPQIRIKSLPNINPISVGGPQGTVVLFDGNMIHQSGENRSGGVRSIFIFEVEPIRQFALEADGTQAIVVNSENFVGPPAWQMALIRGYRYLLDVRLKPTLKRTLFFFYRHFFKNRFVDPSEKPAKT